MSFTKRPWIPNRIKFVGSDGLLTKEAVQWIESLPNFSWQVAPTGAIDGNNKIFKLPESPNPPESLKVWTRAAAATSWTLNAITTGYTLSANVITFVTAPVAGTVLLCDYLTLTQTPH